MHPQDILPEWNNLRLLNRVLSWDQFSFIAIAVVTTPRSLEQGMDENQIKGAE
jgi:hypothetical protein